MYHLLQMTYDLKFTLLWERASIRWLFRMRTLHRQLQVFTEMIQRRFFLVFLRLRLNIIPGNFFWVKCVRFSPCYDLYFWKLPGDFWGFSTISEDFRTLPKIKCPQKFSKTFKHFRSHLKDDTFNVLWYDFVRTQKRTQSHHVLRTICLDLWVRREKLSLMFNWHYMCLLSQILRQKYTNKFHS